MKDPTTGPKSVPAPPTMGRMMISTESGMPKTVLGWSEKRVNRVDRPANAGQERRDDHREHLVAKRRHADGLGGALVLADGRQVHAEAAALDGRGHGRGRNHQAERDVVVGARVLELELPRVAGERDVEADGPADRLHVVGDDAAHLGEGDREQHEVEAAQAEPEAEKADEGAEHRGQRAADEHPHPRREAGGERQDGRGVGADADEGGVAGRELPRVSADDVPGLTEVGVEEDEDEHRDQVGAQHQRQGQQHDDCQRRQVLQIARLPKMPAGLTRRITTRSAKLTSSFIDGLRNTAPSDSATETISPPTNAPSTLPIPPMMTMLKDVTESWRPVGGWKGSSGATSAPAAPTQAAPTANATAETWRTSVPMTCAP